MSTYVFDQAWQKERARLSALESLFDHASRRILSDLGVGRGWRCLEVGCGAGGVALWLADQVGETGRVVATDLDTRFLEGHGRANLDVRAHNIVTDAIDEDAFDLIASRRAAESTYAGIVRLVEEAQRSKAPMSRLADRLALVFLGLTVVIAGAAWLWAGDPIRAVAVLVVVL